MEITCDAYEKLVKECFIALQTPGEAHKKILCYTSYFLLSLFLVFGNNSDETLSFSLDTFTNYKVIERRTISTAKVLKDNKAGIYRWKSPITWH